MFFSQQHIGHYSVYFIFVKFVICKNCVNCLLRQMLSVKTNYDKVFMHNKLTIDYIN